MADGVPADAALDQLTVTHNVFTDEPLILCRSCKWEADGDTLGEFVRAAREHLSQQHPEHTSGGQR